MKTNFKAMLAGDAPVLIDFHATWCGPCQTMAPILEEVKREFGENLKILKVDVDKNKSLAMRFMVRSVPTLILFKNGEQVWRQAGLLTKRELSERIKS